MLPYKLIHTKNLEDLQAECIKAMDDGYGVLKGVTVINRGNEISYLKEAILVPKPKEKNATVK